MRGKLALASPNAPLESFAVANDDDLAEFSDLIGAIYDCALSPERWPETLRDCATFVGGWSASLVGKGRGTVQSTMFYHDHKLEPHYVSAYFTTYAPLDPSTDMHLLAPIETAVSTGDCMDLDEFYQTRFYQEWAAPQHLVDSVMVPLERSANWTAMLALLLHETSVTVEEAKRRIALIVPHVRRAALIGKVLDHRSVEIDNLRNVLDGLAAGVFLVDAAGEIAFSNEAAQTLLRANGPLLARRGMLTCRDADAARELAAAFRAAGEGDAALGTRGISIPLQDDNGERFVAHTLPLTSGSRRDAGNQAAAAVFVHPTVIDAPQLPQALARSFGLTQTELRVMLSIVDVGGVPETARALGIAETTAKTHLSRVFDKTGVNRQADLVKIVAGFSGPLVKT